MLVYLVRWEPAYLGGKGHTSSEEELGGGTCYPNQSVTIWSGWLIPIACWVCWQVIYLYVQFSHLDFHPELVTSQRYIFEHAHKSVIVTKWGQLTGTNVRAV